MMQLRYLTPTGIANYVYCKRLFYLNTIHPHSGQTTHLTALGLFEHEVFAKFAELTKLDWQRSDGLHECITDTLQSRLSKVLEFAIKISRENYAQFMDYLEKNLPSLRLRLITLDRNRVKSAIGLLQKGTDMNEVIDSVLPWKIEQKLESQKFGIKGRVDALYRIGDNLVAEDIKTHNTRLDAFIHRQEHEAQLATYAILAEENYGLQVKKTQIFYSQDLTVESFKINQDSKSKIIEIAKEAPSALGNDLPPRLEGEEAIKCQHCYMREICFGMDRRTAEEIIDNEDTEHQILEARR